MFNEDDIPKKTTEVKNLTVLSVQALEEYIVELRDEIKRAEAEIAKKRSVRTGADSLFKK
jgi:uncharacterized small protein (DUF1192 family)